MAELEKSIDRDGITVDGSKGQLRVHPALVEVRQLRLAQLRLLSSIELTDPQASLRASTLARSYRRAMPHARDGLITSEGGVLVGRRKQQAEDPAVSEAERRRAVSVPRPAAGG